MTRNAITVLLLSGFLLGIASPGFAEREENEYARSGPYFGAGLGIGIDNFTDYPKVKTGLGLEAWGGFRLLKYLGLELQVEYLDRMNTDIPNTADPGFDAAEVDLLTFTGNVKGYLLTGRIQPFVLAGVGMTYVNADCKGCSSVDDLDLSARFGGGIDLYDSPELSINLSASYVLTTGAVDDFDYVSLGIGIQYRF